MLAGTDLPLWGMEVDPDAATADFRAVSSLHTANAFNASASPVAETAASLTLLSMRSVRRRPPPRTTAPACPTSWGAWASGRWRGS
jgi:hypothetical protein